LLFLLIINKAQGVVLVLRQDSIDEFSVFLVFRSKAPCADNGHSLVKCGNVAAGHQKSALRVSLSASLDGVAPLGKGMTIARKARLARNADKSH